MRARPLLPLMLTLPLMLAATDVGADQPARPLGDQARDTAQRGGKVVNDTWLTSKVKIALYADSRVSGTKVNVDSKNGVVTLRGKVDSEEAKGAAAELAKGIDGVQSVNNELQVVPPGKRKAVEAKDDAIQDQVKKALERDPLLRDSGVDVRSDAGVVTLSGKARSWGASARASELARWIGGVRQVKNNITVEE